MSCGLRIELAGQDLAQVALSERPVVLGRAPECDVQIADQRLSRRHCQVQLHGERLIVTDLGSSNGTYVRGQRINQATLDVGDSLYMGKTRVVFEREGAGAGVPGENDQTTIIPRSAPPPPSAPPGFAPAPGARPQSAAGYGATQTPFAPPVGLEPGSGLHPPAPPPGGGSAARDEIPAAMRATRQANYQIEGYQIFDELGKGSMGIVYTARSMESGEVCVLKTVKFSGSPKDAIFFIRECQAGMKIKHPNVVELLDFGESSGHLFLAFEYVPGGNLLQRIKSHGPVSNHAAVEQLVGLTSALQYAYRKKIVHRDIKPANILINPDGVAKLADFGLAKTMLQAGKQGLTQAGEARGTPIYMAPEMLMSASEADQRADIYSLGATYYHALTGHHPFRGRTVPEILRMVVQQEPVDVVERRPDIHPDLANLVRYMMVKDPSQRLQTPDDVMEHLRYIERAL